MVALVAGGCRRFILANEPVWIIQNGYILMNWKLAFIITVKHIESLNLNHL